MAVNNTVAFWKGVRLWQFAKCLRAQPAGAGGGPRAGLSRNRGRLGGTRSPNFIYQIMVPCWAPAIGGDHPDSAALLSGVGYQVTRQVYVSKTLEFLIDNSGGTKGVGYLAWVENADAMLTVSAPQSGGANRTVSYTGSGFTPAAGNLVLLRNKTSGEGFVSAISGVGVGTITVNLQRHGAERSTVTGDPAVEDVAVVATDWNIYKVAYYYDRVDFQSLQDPEVPNMAEDKAIFNLNYQFLAERGIVYPASYSPDFS